MTLKFAIAVCTYNPNPHLLGCLLNAIQGIISVTPVGEVILVDNNSFPSIKELPSVRDFLLAVPLARCIVEAKQGLTAARCRAIHETTAPIIVFFDDDNEPSSNYLQVLSRYFKDYPNVGVWGPGQIIVKYVDSVEPWFEQHPEKFQQRQSDFGYSCIPATWNPCSPNGTGFAVRREILQKYLEATEQDSLHTTGRKGESLASAEDVQIVWEGIKLGFAAGMIPELCCNHLITAEKANLTYLKRLEFGTASSYAPALLESFPQQLDHYQADIPSILHMYRYLAKYWLKMALRPEQRYENQLKLANNLGGWYGLAKARRSPRANNLLTIARRLHLTQ